ncbi:MAG: ACP S-malonyltransferase [Ignavibacteria bacterium]|jgi:[acyl-carrier-protein] S-malonyltransferase|nr:ACP S-malonyltransferase [Ignavibacteria bacterium]
MKTALLCSGQGSQYVGMIKDIADKYPQIEELAKQADEVVGYPLTSICYEGPADKLKETRYTQPALFLHSAAVYEVVKDRIGLDAVAGHSVGEYAALYIAGVLSFEDALNLVSLRGQLMYVAGEDVQGTMFAVINLADDKLLEVCNSLTDAEKGLYVVPANYNSPGQVVVSGSAEHLRQHIGMFKDAGARMTKELVVSGAFHSPLMLPAQNKLEEAINSIDFNDAKVPVYANVTAAPLTSGEELRKLLIQQLTSPVQWTQTILNMHSNGISNFIEIGAGAVLQGLVKRIVSGDDIVISGYDKDF